jgi:hypothetical protein
VFSASKPTQFIEITFKEIKIYSEPSGQKLKMQQFQKIS